MLHVLFPDFEKIFGMYSKCSSRKDIPDKLIVTIRAIYDGTKYFVLHQRKISAGSKMKSVKIAFYHRYHFLLLSIRLFMPS